MGSGVVHRRGPLKLKLSSFIVSAALILTRIHRFQSFQQKHTSVAIKGGSCRHDELIQLDRTIKSIHNTCSTRRLRLTDLDIFNGKCIARTPVAFIKNEVTVTAGHDEQLLLCIATIVTVARVVQETVAKQPVTWQMSCQNQILAHRTVAPKGCRAFFVFRARDALSPLLQ